MSGFLEEMARASRDRVQEARHACSEARLLDQAMKAPPPPQLKRDDRGFDLIAELKLRSPAVGQLKSPTEEDVGARVSAYGRAGAAAVSVLTEPTRFDGSLAHLAEAVQALAPLGIPVMRKDFLVDPYQVIEARVAGASGVLVILRMLPREPLQTLLDCARSLGLFVLLEAFDERDIELMHELLGAQKEAGQLLAGVNCRDLSTLQVVPRRLMQLCPLLPPVPKVAESGVLKSSDAAEVAAAGYDLALVGSALMQGDQPQRLAAELLEAGRAARNSVGSRACG